MSETCHYRGVPLDGRFIPNLLEQLDEWSRKHSRASAEWAERIARELGLREGDIRALRLASLLHAIDRLGVPPEEYDICRMTEAEEARLRRSPAILGRLVPEEELGRVMDTVVAARERWDGSGRPRGLTGEAVPLLARIVAVACAFVTLTMDQPGVAPLQRSVACERLTLQAGRSYDPQLAGPLWRAVARFEREHGGGRCDS